jgi:hypothetical protein
MADQEEVVAGHAAPQLGPQSFLDLSVLRLFTWYGRTADD